MSLYARRGHAQLLLLDFPKYAPMAASIRPDTPTYLPRRAIPIRRVSTLSPIISSPFLTQTLSTSSNSSSPITTSPASSPSTTPLSTPPSSPPCLPPPSTPSSLFTGIPLSARLFFHHAFALPPTPPVKNHGDPYEEAGPLSPKSVRRLQSSAYASLNVTDVPYIKAAIRLLELRDSNPQRCVEEAPVMSEDLEIPRCWRARAAVYHAEALWKLGCKTEAKRELDQIETWFAVGEPEPRYEVMETLIKLNLYIGQLNWDCGSPLPNSQFINPPKADTVNPAMVFV